MLRLPKGSRVVAVSGGNHGQAVAYVGSVLGLETRVIMPRDTPENYLNATRGYGGELVLVENHTEGFARAAASVKEGWIMAHPFDDLDIIAGQGTVGLEMVADVPELTDVIVSVGGGGLMSGVAVAVKESKPGARVWGVETEGAHCMSLALKAGHPVTLEKMTSVARTLGAPSASEFTLGVAQKYLDGLEVVSDAEAISAVKFLLERAKVLTEPAASCTLAAAERLKPRLTKDGHLVLVLCGGNLSVRELASWA
jgi:threonine dehydratase